MTRSTGELDRRWNDMYVKLKAYFEEHGDCNVPQGWTESPNLARWVNTQRERARQGNMAIDRKALLDDINFWWGTSNEDRWGSMYAKLIEYHKENGHYHVPCSYPSDKPFAKWVTKQKAALRTDDLTLERKEKLVSIGFPGPRPKRKRRTKEEADEHESAAKKQALAFVQE
jgi:hypothetical protein